MKTLLELQKAKDQNKNLIGKFAMKKGSKSKLKVINLLILPVENMSITSLFHQDFYVAGADNDLYVIIGVVPSPQFRITLSDFNNQYWY